MRESVESSVRPANRLGLDYCSEASRLGPPPAPIWDVHTHINGRKAVDIYLKATELYGIERVYSMTHLEEVRAVREVLGERLRLIAVPQFTAEDKKTAFTTGWLDRLDGYHQEGCRICKFWAAPRSRDFEKELGMPGLLSLRHEWRRRTIEKAHALGMMFMTHIADPDTWFETKYADASFYGTKREQYEPLEEVLDEYRNTPWIAAHMGGSPEDLEFLDNLMGRHANLYLDTSATKWMVRELSKHDSKDLLQFLRRWNGRILFGSDIVTLDSHLGDGDETKMGMGSLASSHEQAFELYASRYFALRTMFETGYDDESPIVDPDLVMVDPDTYDESSAPNLRGHSLPRDVLTMVYRDAGRQLLDAWEAGTWQPIQH